jgi:hypothetical protein
MKRQMAAAKQKGSTDIEEMVSSRLGHAVHKAAEIAWLEKREQAFNNLNLPQTVRDRIRVNPDGPGPEDAIDIYIEQRRTKEIMGYKISGMFDYVMNGVVEDVKTTQTYNWIKGTHDEKYMQQAAIYRWLNPGIITADFCRIHFMFTDWKAHLMLQNPDYPKSRIKTKHMNMMSYEQTEQFIKARLSAIIPWLNKTQELLPLCTKEDLWQDDPVFKWYKNGVVTTKSTKNFPSLSEAMTHSGGAGLVVPHPAKAKRCNYCDARPFCTQAAQLYDNKLLD